MTNGGNYVNKYSIKNTIHKIDTSHLCTIVG